jgi:hypothetical protein
MPMLKPRSDRQNVTGRHALVQRVRSEWQEMPGSSLTLAQAARLFSIPQEACQWVLAFLVEEGVISLSNGHYVRRATSGP